MIEFVIGLIVVLAVIGCVGEDEPTTSSKRRLPERE